MPPKEFKPVQREKMSDSEKSTHDFINLQWTTHPFIENYHGKWEEYIAWWEGDQYAYWNSFASKLVDVQDLITQLDPGRESKNVYNRITPLVRQIWGDIKYPYEFKVIPNTAEPEDVKAARVGSFFIEFTNTLRKYQVKVDRAKLWAIITGICYWKEWWNKSLTGYSVDNKGKMIEVKGDIDYDYVNPFNCRPDPTSDAREGWRWFLEGKRVPLKKLEEEFGIPSGSIKPESRDKTNTGLFERAEFKRSEEETAVRKEFWQLPTDEYSKGRFVVQCQDWLLGSDDKPGPKDDLPYFPILGVIPILDEPIGDSIVRIAQPGQRQLNRYGSMIDDHVKNWKIKGMIPWGSLRPGDKEAFTRKGVDYVTYNSRLGAPYYQSPPPIPDFLGFMLNYSEKEIETTTSVRETSYAQLPKRASRASNVLFESLRGQDESVLIPAVEEQEASLMAAQKYRLGLLQENYDEERLTKTMGKSKSSTVAFFKGAEIRGNTDVRIAPGADFLTTKNRKDEAARVLVEQGLVTEPRQALELFGLSSVEEFYEEELIDERQATRQLEIMKYKDIYIESNPDDNHEVMFKTFNNARKAEDFESLKDKNRTNIERRIEEEKALLNTPETPPPGEIVEEGAQGVEGAPVPAAAPVGPNPPSSQEEILMALMNQMQGG